MSIIKIDIDKSELQLIKQRLRDLKKTAHPTARRSILKPAAQIVIDEAKRNVSVSKEPHYRYKDGVKVATYKPGNLMRSLQILGNLGKLAGTIIAGPKRSKDGKGIFSGRRVDGWYAGIVEKTKPYLRPAFIAKKDEAEKIIKKGFKELVDNAIR